MVSLSKRRPQEEHDGAFSHTPDSGEEASKRRAQDFSSEESSSNLVKVADTLKESPGLLAMLTSYWSRQGVVLGP